MENKYTVLFKNTFIFALGNLGSKLIVFLLVITPLGKKDPSLFNVYEILWVLSIVLIES